MATILPAITQPVTKPLSRPQHSMPVTQGEKATKKSNRTGPPTVVVRQMLNKKECELQERRLAARSKLPELTEWQTDEYNNTYKQSLCLEVLEHGFHRSFAEIFGLIKQQEDRRLAAGPDSILWAQCPLTEEHEKLDVMKNQLVEAESAMLLGDYMRVYQCHHYLAQYFQSTGDKWLADHFYENCLHYSANVKNDDGKVAAEGHCNVGISLEEAGQLAEAAHNFELCYSLTKGKTDWLVADSETSMHSQSCSNLTRIYGSIASQYREQNDHEASLQYLIRAYEMSKEGGDKKLFGEASYQLGLAYISDGDPQRALTHLQCYLETCQEHEDSEGIGKACEAIAKAYDRQGRVDESIKYLEKFIQVSEENKDDMALSHACNSLGIRFNCLGEYKQAFDNFSRAYNIARPLGNTSVLQLSRVLSGTAHAHDMLRDYERHIHAQGSRTSAARLLDWKDNRGEEFDRPLTPPPDSADPTNNEAIPSSPEIAVLFGEQQENDNIEDNVSDNQESS